MKRKPSTAHLVYISGHNPATPIANRILVTMDVARERNISPGKVYITQRTFAALSFELRPRLLGRTSAQENYINGIRLIVR